MTRRENEPLPNDRELAARIAQGEAALFAVVMKRYNQRLYRIARGMGIQDADCDDLLQQSYIQAYLKLPQFRGDSSLSTWLTRIVINQCLMFLRKKRPAITEYGELEGFESRSHEEQADPSQNPEYDLIREETRQLLERAIDALPEDYRIVYVMREIEELSVRDIAASLDITEANVKVRIHRARKLLQAHLRKVAGASPIYEFGNHRCDAIVHRVLVAISETI